MVYHWRLEQPYFKIVLDKARSRQLKCHAQGAAETSATNAASNNLATRTEHAMRDNHKQEICGGEEIFSAAV